jgi:type IV secretion system protein VirB10
MKMPKFFKNEPDSDDEEKIEGERELASLNKGMKLQNRITNWALMVTACGLAGVLLYKHYVNVYQTYKSAEVLSKDITRTVGTGTLPPLTMPDPEAIKFSAEPAASDALPPLGASGSPLRTDGAIGLARVRTSVEIVRERRLKKEVRFNLDGTLAGALSASSPGDSSGPGDMGGATTLATHSGPRLVTASAVPQSGSTPTRAYVVPDPTLMMTRGRAIPCTVIPAIDTTLTGIVTCVTAEDATGADNRVSLMDRGTLCTGQQGGGVIRGQSRVGIIWQLCETPQHVRVPLESVAADSLGRPGIPGIVDNHFWDRFGAAIALSLISDIGPYLVATRQGGSNNTTIAFPAITGPQEVMTEALKSTVGIPPTITASQGTQVLIYLAGDVDFRDVYQLEMAK